MGKFLDGINQVMRGSRSALTPLPQLFPPVDLDYIRSAVRIEQRAKEYGEKNLPPSNAHTQDAVELDVSARLKEVLSRYLADYDQQVRIVNDRIYEYGALLDLQSINSDCQKKLSDLKAQAELETNDLYRVAQTLKNKAAEIHHFRADNGLERRLPDYPKNPWMQAAILALLVVVEILINFLLIKEAGDMASVAGSAALYSFVNVIVPYLWISEWVRYKNHRKIESIWLGRLIAAFFVVYALSVNLMMAHYRGVVIDMTAQVQVAENLDASFLFAFLRNQATAWENFVNSPFGLKDTFSWFLWVFGMALSFGGLLSGYRRDDRYPGYGNLDRAYHKIFDAYIDAVDDTVTSLKDERDEGAAEINTARKTLEMEFKKIPNLVANAEAIRARCVLAIERLDTDYNLLVKEYRQANQLVRTEASPEYFDREVTLGDHPVPGHRFPDVEKPQKAVDALQKYSDELHKMFDKIIGKLESTRQVVEDDYPFKVDK